MSTTENSNPLAKLAKLASQLPKGLRSDWRGTNHFELTNGDKHYWWLLFGEMLDDYVNPAESEEGRRIGLIMDIAAEVGRLKDEGLLPSANECSPARAPTV